MAIRQHVLDRGGSISHTQAREERDRRVKANQRAGKPNPRRFAAA